MVNFLVGLLSVLGLVDHLVGVHRLAKQARAHAKTCEERHLAPDQCYAEWEAMRR
jgi:hypothetical protein